MSIRFTVLASGSRGNASLLRASGFGVLIDAGLSPRELSPRLAAAGAGWSDVDVLLLTHTHTDHWQDPTLAPLHARGVPVYCHPHHHEALQAYSEAYPALHQAGLARTYAPHQELILGPGLRVRPLPVSHDSRGTCGFRLETAGDLFGGGWALAYLADLGCWDGALVEQVADVDVLALEFNHDPRLEALSGRPGYLIRRVMGSRGHLSKDQAAGMLRAVLAQSTPARLRHLVQLHLSQDCNTPELAAAAARAVLRDTGHELEVHTAAQHEAGPVLHLNGARPSARGSRARRPARSRTSRMAQPFLPGLDIA